MHARIILFSVFCEKTEPILLLKVSEIPTNDRRDLEAEDLASTSMGWARGQDY